MAVSSTIIIIVVAVVAVLLLLSLLVSYHLFWSKSKRKVPLPPVQPLAHDRERSLHVYAVEKERERSLFLQIQIAPSWSEPGTIKSAVSSESGSTANTMGYPPVPPIPPGISSLNRHAPPRPLSLASSAHTSRSNFSRAIPHAPDSNVQIVLPAPLGATTMDYSRDSIADGWVSQVINSSQPIRSRSRSRSQSLPRSYTRSSLGTSYVHTPNPTPSDLYVRNRSRTNSLPYSTSSSNQIPPIPPMPSQYTSYVAQIPPPPVPHTHSVYGQPSSSSLSFHSDAADAENEYRGRNRGRGPSQGRPLTSPEEASAYKSVQQNGRPKMRSSSRGRRR
ncbi:hypothetical protein DFH05DRAFT_1518285 [Lentinula detonsa]|uniref:Uncharacterized protein n=1 Tax=Lentinula detonsa TaxID=2804962 RepID=A0A9W8U2H9_9AGAR|nr:hypothetical protein DFH05DRAFT_1518285 [Lentinula detonsa]